MKDVYFEDYGKRKKNKYDTSEIPLSETERKMQEKIKQQRYEEIVKKQQQNGQYSRRRDQQSGENSAYRQAEQRPPVKEKAPKKKKKGCGCFTFLICIVLIAALLAGGTFGYVYSLCGNVNYIETDDSVHTAGLQSDPSVYNLLLIGADKEDGGVSRSDTMMLASFDKTNKTVKFTSFMRDMWVDIPENGSAKLNAAFAYGGAPLLIQTLESNFKIKIDNYMFVDFEMFEKLIDGIGGVTVEITEAEAEFINRTSHAKVTPGTNTLNGDYALIYCRIRKLDSDFMRTQRQRKVMAAIIEQIKTQPLTDTVSAGVNILPLITTDIPQLQLTFLLFRAVSLLNYGNDQLRIPADGTYRSETIRGQDSLVPDIEANREAISDFIYG